MKLHFFTVLAIATAAYCTPIVKRSYAEPEGAAEWPSLPTIEEKRGYAEPEGAAEWPSLPTIEEKRSYAEPEGAAEWPSLPTIEDTGEKRQSQSSSARLRNGLSSK
ncbi:hypothetical protein A9K55_007811 [Cordyceps militaris]|uniref:Secreted protein n=1 Tax=Cordyceps militaris TaxID=73501 RepID=A0A2H4SKD2_CORMI|nr:hypothetical protein A9K55_007811 [Cordyceps militaris]